MNKIFNFGAAIFLFIGVEGLFPLKKHFIQLE